MKKFLFIVMLCAFAVTSSAQQITEEVENMLRQYEQTKNDSSKGIDLRKLASFKYDATYYLLSKCKTERQLGLQTNAMVEFVNLYVSQLKRIGSKWRKRLMEDFSDACTRHCLFHDQDFDVVHAYIGDDRYLTQFSLDTDWVRALEDVQKK